MTRGQKNDSSSGRLADLQVASQEIGGTSDARLAWVVGFVTENREAWHSARRAAHSDCLIALAHGGFPPNLIGGVNPPPPMKDAEIESLHRELGAMLRALVNWDPGAVVTIPSDNLVSGLVRVSAKGARPAIFATTFGGSTRTAVLQRVKDLVLRAGARLNACPECSAPFLAVRKQRFCSPQCAQRARNERKADWPNRRKSKSKERAHGKTSRTR